MVGFKEQIKPTSAFSLVFDLVSAWMWECNSSWSIEDLLKNKNKKKRDTKIRYKIKDEKRR